MKINNYLLYLVFTIYSSNICGHYCESKCYSGIYNDITKIEIFQSSSLIFSNTNGCGILAGGSGSIIGQYANYTSNIIPLQRGQNYTMNVYFSSCSSPVSSGLTYVVVYLDLNKNYIFDTPAERLVWTGPVTVPAGGSNTFSFGFTIPFSATADTSRLRIIAGYEGGTGKYPAPCDTSNYFRGETEDYTVTFCEPVSRSIAKVSPKCYADTNGKIKLTATGGNNPKVYAWNGGSYGSTDSLVNIVAGMYTVITKDSIGCKYYDTILLTQPTPLLLSKQVDSVCFNANSGKISVNGVGGKFPYAYQLNTGGYGSTKLWSNLSKGIYIVSLKDSNACIKKDTINLDTFARFPYQKYVEPILCQNSKGLINLMTVGADTSRFISYAINGASFMPTSLGGYYSGKTLNAGLYTFVLKDKHNCLYYDTVRLDTPPVQSLRLKSKRDIGCNGSTSGMIKIERIGGNPSLSYWYQWSQLASPGNTFLDSFDNLPIGTYRIFLKDNQGCSQDSLVVQIQNAQSNIKAAYSLLYPHNCIKDSINTIKITGSGGKSPYTFSINYGAWTSVDTARITHDPVYDVFIVNVKIRDSNGCQADTNYDIYPLSLPYIRFSQLDPIGCGGQNNNRILFRLSYPQYAKLPILFSVNNSPYQTDSLFINLPGDNRFYTYQFKDAIGCIYQDSLFISSSPALIVSYVGGNSSCVNSGDGSIKILASGGTPPYKYSINGGLFQTSNQFSNLANGKYWVVTKDSLTCSKGDSITVSGLKYNFKLSELSSIRCHGDSNAQLSALLEGADIYSTPLYSINNSTYSTINNWGNLKAGIYNVKIKYNTSCLLDTNYEIKEPPLLSTVFSKLDIPCFGQAKGNIQTQTTGGTPPYTLWINNVSQGNVSLLNNVSAGFYFVEVRDKNNCIDSQTLVLTQPNKLELLLVRKQDPICANSNNGLIEIAIKGGTPTYTNQWSTGDIDTYVKQNLGDGLYTIQATDMNGCIEKIYVPLTVPSPLIAKFIISEIKCYNDSTGRLDTRVEGGVPPYRYLWENFSNASYRDKLTANTPYYVMIGDNNGCIDTLFYTFKNPEPIQLLVSKTDATCYNSKDGIISVMAKGGTIQVGNSFFYSLDQQPKTKDHFFMNLPPKLYHISTYDDNLCIKDTQISIGSVPRVSVTIDSIYILDKLGSSITLNPQIIGLASDIGYFWNSNIGLSCTDCINPVFSGYLTSNYTLVIKYNQNRCIDSTHTKIIVPTSESEQIFIPNAFSPNGADKSENEVFKVYGNLIKSLTISIYNRWGEKVFESNDKLKGWDGTYKGTPAPMGVYNYHAEIKFLDNRIVVRNGEVMLIR